MTLEQLRIFVSVAEREHVTAAARALNVTQSTVSASIAALEARHAIRLFDRVGRGIVLTEAGRIFLDEARRVLADAEHARNVLDELGGLRRGTLRMMASQTIAGYWLPPLVVEYRRRFPAIRILVELGNTEQVANAVREGRSELGVVEGHVDDPALMAWTVGFDRLRLVRSTPFDGETVDRNWLENAAWIAREPGSGTRSFLDRALRKSGINPSTLRDVLVLPSNESVRTAAESGAGVAALSSLVVSAALASGALYAAPLDFGPRPFFGLSHRERSRSRAVAAFLDLIGEMGEAESGRGAGAGPGSSRARP
ncbi:LysR substrate-binding domain-containing protein [Brytella acorum]|uniref:LysR substrate-binding domain-containing protein n=1 Tax=Brytella acorum TaxID=2959299 RepID=A0AA35UYH6_9PROT|nr:LysR substrate-binding domain-containing protein [Brytella acorum]MDF3625606.1 LysR substrate-binding domain-containing protein [Brytella acorum]CAI9119471.1 LysR substrate-binding domain-containing protein [Brytella acorum]